MCLLLETIKIEDGEIRNLEYHNRRFNESRRSMFGKGNSINRGTDIDLGSVISLPPGISTGVFRCRVLYRRKIEKIEFVPHKELIVRSLKLVISDDIDYTVKYADRELLMSLFEQRENCDEILIVKNGFITDTSISNIIFRRSDGSWVTPDTPLLNGTMRMYLLENGSIIEAVVRPEDISSFTGARMINCMMGFDTSPLIEINSIYG